MPWTHDGQYTRATRGVRVTIRFSAAEVDLIEGTRDDARQLGMFGRSRGFGSVVRKLALQAAVARTREERQTNRPADLSDKAVDRNVRQSAVPDEEWSPLPPPREKR